MDKFYDLVITNKMLTKNQLIEYGLNDENIKELINKRKLKQNEFDTYEFMDIYELILYGKKLLKNKQSDKAKLCFLKCLEINSKNNSVAFYLFSICIREKNYEEAFKYLEMLINGNDYNQNDNNLYLYLFSFVIELPNKYKVMVENMLPLDVEHTGDIDYMIDINTIRTLILRRKFSLALKKLNKFLENKEKIMASDFITKRLLNEIMDLKHTTENELNQLIKTKDYEKIINLLESRPNLFLEEEYILKLSYIYKTINKKIPKPNLEYTPDFFIALDRNNFELALKINKNDNGIFSIILTDLLDRISKENIFISLEQLDLEETFKLLNQYLVRINKLEYEKGIMNIIRLCIVKNDVSFIKLREVLDLLEKTGKIDVGFFVEKFYKCLNENDYEESKYYISIISNLEKDDELSSYLKKELDNKRNNNKVKKEVKNDKPKRKYNNSNQSIKINDSLLNNPDYIFLEQKSKELETEKIIIINDLKQIKIVKRLIRCFNNMQFFSIGNYEIVLKQKKNDSINLKQLYQNGYDAFKNKDYNKAIECYELLNSLSNKNTAVCYSRLGWSYFYLNKFDIALKYFVIADKLNKIEGKNYDLSKQIKYLEKIMNGDKSINNDDVDNVLNDIVDLINSNSISIDEACIKFNLDEFEINYVKLIIARDCYIQSDYITGDKILKAVEKSKSKNKKILDLLNEIRKNKLFYKNREENEKLISNSKILKI